MRRFTIAMFFAAPLAALAMPASASVVILGNGLGRECYVAAVLKRDPKPSLGICTSALQGEELSLRDRAATYVNRGVIHAAAHDPEMALRDYEAAINLDANLADAYVNAGMALLQIGGRDREAIDTLTRAILLGTARMEMAYYTRAVAYEMVGEVRAAYEDYQAALEAKPGWEAPLEQLKRFKVVRRETARG